MRVLVLGAGVVGVATAYYLNRAGAEVTVLDRHDAVARETSFANGGQLSAESAGPWANPEALALALGSLFRDDSPLKIRLRADRALAAWALRFLRNCTAAREARNKARLLPLGLLSREAQAALVADTGIAFDQAMRGILCLYRDARSFARARRAAEGSAPEAEHAVSAAECVDIEPALASSRGRIAGGIYYPRDGSGDARRFSEELAAVLRAGGVRFELSRQLRRLRAEGPRIVAAETDGGALEADAYVLCLGVASPLIARPLGLRLPIYPVKGYSVTLPVAGANGAPRVSLSDEARKIVISRLGEQVRAAGTAELSGYDLSLDPRRSRAILDALLDLLPRAGDPAQAEFWAGLRPMTPDGAPILGATPCRNLFLNTGHGTLGWTLACGSGQLVADLVVGKKPRLALEEFGVDRF